MATALKEISTRLGIGLVYKTSFDKANRTSASGGRGIGLKQALPIFADIRNELGLPVLTDVHEQRAVRDRRRSRSTSCRSRPSCRARPICSSPPRDTGKIVNVKKGQFLAPWDMKNVVAKVTGAGNPNVLVTERGASFGYNTLVSDMRALPILARTTGAPVIFDATHSVQQPGGQGASSGGEREFVPVLARAAVAVGVAGVFIETHQDPDRAPSDGPNMVPLKEFEGLLRTLMAFDRLAKSHSSALSGLTERPRTAAAGGCTICFRSLPCRRSRARCRARAMDPVLPQVAADLAVTIQVAATLASAFAVTFALVQPALGIVADVFGKPKLIFICLILLGASNIAGAFSTSFDMLLVTRALSGIGGGGVSAGHARSRRRPVSDARTAGRAEPDPGRRDGRQSARREPLRPDRRLHRLARRADRDRPLRARCFGGRRLGFPRIRCACRAADQFCRHRCGTIAPSSRIRMRASAIVGVFIEGCCVLGLFPFVAAFLAELGEPRLSIAGLVIAGFPIGGLVYTSSVSRLLPRLGEKGLMIGGGALMASQLVAIALGPPWQVQLACFVVLGCGFYMIHGSLQTFASEISIEARRHGGGAARLLLLPRPDGGADRLRLRHSATFGKLPTLLAAAAIMLLLGIRLRAAVAAQARRDADSEG